MSASSPTFPTRAILLLSTIYFVRMLGLFIVLPIFALDVPLLKDVTPDLIGIALGIYGLTQATFQIPLAAWSDRIGRKTVIALGITVFICGSVMAALAQSIHMIIIARALQGAGAIGSTVIALVSDLTAIENRTKAMAIIGISIGLSFATAMVLGPTLNAWIGLTGIFWITAALGSLSLLLLFLAPQPPRLLFQANETRLSTRLISLITHKELLRLNIGIFILHSILTASFLVIPTLIIQSSPWAAKHSWSVYLAVLICAFVAVAIMIRTAEKRRKLKGIFLSALAALMLSQALLWQVHTSFWLLSMTLWLFFTAFTFSEATLPSLVSKLAPAQHKGAAIGIYSTWQFLGIFFGGSMGGWILGHYHTVGICLFGLLLSMLWFVIVLPMRQPANLGTITISIGILTKEQAQQLSQKYQTIPGVIEAAILLREGIAYIKVDKDVVNMDVLLNNT